MNSSDNISWSDNTSTVTIKKFKGYDKPYGPTFSTPTSILHIFCFFFTNELLQTIVTETNRYASLCLKERYDNWDKVTIDELKAYFGFMILMGIVRLPAIRDYWRTNEAFHYRPIADRISRTHFLQLHRFLHFVNNEKLPADNNYSKIQKVKPILTYLSNISDKLFTPGRDIAIDEAMVKFKGRSSLKQCLPKKPVKRGFKIWMRADSDSGYVSKFEVYEGKKSNKVEKGLGGSVVMRLTEEIHKKYHHIYFDGTMRSDRKGFPSTLKTIVKRGLPNRGDFVTAHNGNLVMTVWQDTKAICCASTNSDPNTTQTITRKQKDGSVLKVNCPESIVSYNAKMGGVDRNDQLRGYYSIKLKSPRLKKRKCEGV